MNCSLFLFPVYLDGTKSEEDLCSQVYEDLRQELAKQKCKYCPIEVGGEGTARIMVHHTTKKGIPECYCKSDCMHSFIALKIIHHQRL